MDFMWRRGRDSVTIPLLSLNHYSYLIAKTQRVRIVTKISRKWAPYGHTHNAN